MRTLVLGGTAEAKEIIKRLVQKHVSVTYSHKGDISIPDLPCSIVSGGFKSYANNSIHGLRQYIKQHEIKLIIDATHPYAEKMSHNAVKACQKSNINLIQFCRKPWQKTVQDNWIIAQSYMHISQLMQQYQRPFISIGYSSEALLKTMPITLAKKIKSAPNYLIRQIKQPDNIAINQRYIFAQGPFSIANEIELMKQYKIDVLISKNSGGINNFNKILAARKLNLPVIMLKRPKLSTTQPAHMVNDIESCVEQCIDLLNTHESYIIRKLCS